MLNESFCRRQVMDPHSKSIRRTRTLFNDEGEFEFCPQRRHPIQAEDIFGYDFTAHICALIFVVIVVCCWERRLRNIPR